jgi:hypothetical protein
VAAPRALITVLYATLALPVFAQSNSEEQERNKREAVQRVVDSHDMTLLLGGGRLMIKQAAVRSARRLLREWGQEAGLQGEWRDDAPEYRTSKAELLSLADAAIQRSYAPGAWLKTIWYEYTANELNGEAADQIAEVFKTEGGRRTRMLMDWYLGEMILFNYTFTDRFEYEVADAEHELKALQVEAQKRLPGEDVEFTSRYPEAFQFLACSPDSRYCLGPRYWNMLILPLMGEVIRYVDGVSAGIEVEMRAKRPFVQNQIEAFKARR